MAYDLCNIVGENGDRFRTSGEHEHTLLAMLLTIHNSISLLPTAFRTSTGTRTGERHSLPPPEPSELDHNRAAQRPGRRRRRGLRRCAYTKALLTFCSALLGSGPCFWPVAPVRKIPYVKTAQAE